MKGIGKRVEISYRGRFCRGEDMDFAVDDEALFRAAMIEAAPEYFRELLSSAELEPGGIATGYMFVSDGEPINGFIRLGATLKGRCDEEDFDVFDIAVRGYAFVPC